MRILVLEWCRRGAGPRFAASFAGSLQERSGVEVAPSLRQVPILVARHAASETAASAAEVTKLHAKIDQAVVERDFW